MKTPTRGEVWWVAFDPGLGGEVRKTRPAVVVSNDVANRALNRVVVVPLGTRTGRVYPGEAPLTFGGRQGKAMADQIRAVSTSRLGRREGSLSGDEMRALEDAILLHLGIRR
jgi:mRNA interferase MazF